MWFEKLTGFKEQSAEQVRGQLEIVDDYFISRTTGQKCIFGRLEIPTLEQLKKQCPNLSSFNQKIEISERVGDIQEIHRNPANQHSLFQAASQFNLLEMVNPTISPEYGINNYEYDHTQGPACAIACGAGTIYRNYFVRINGQQGQTAEKQIDCLEEIGSALNNPELQYWTMQNGYALMEQSGILALNKVIAKLNHEEREMLKGKLKTGIQWQTEVTISDTRHKVSQIYCSALPVAYSQTDSIYSMYFSRIILESLYESTLYAATLNMIRNGSNKVFLTLVGGGAFRNEEYWILESLKIALEKFKRVPLKVYIVSHSQSNPNIIKCINQLK